jgi:hypothetical protein
MTTYSATFQVGHAEELQKLLLKDDGCERAACNVISLKGQPIKSAKTAFRTLRTETSPPISTHVLKQSAVTWGLQRATICEMPQLRGTSTKTLERG